MSERTAPHVEECASTHCITCADDGEAMSVVEVDGVRGLAMCRDEAGELATVETALVAPIAAGDVLLVHAGTAIAALEHGEGAP